MAAGGLSGQTGAWDSGMGDLGSWYEWRLFVRIRQGTAKGLGQGQALGCVTCGSLDKPGCQSGFLGRNSGPRSPRTGSGVQIRTTPGLAW